LTQGQRDLLEGTADYSPTSSKGRATRTRLRNRVKVGIRDFAYLADPELFDRRDLAQLYDDEADRARLGEELSEMVAFIYRTQPDRIESVVEEGIQKGVQRISPGYEVDEVTISIRKRGQILERARRRIENDEPLTDGQVRAMLEHGQMDPDKLREYVKTHPSPYSADYRRRYRGP
jgi:hypothetical protein